jgi:hypothetical protein
VESQGKLGIQTQKKRETSGIPREARDPNSKEERNEWNPKGSLGSKLKRREKRVESQGKVGIQTQKKRETSGIPREARDPNSKEDEGTSRGGSPILHPIFVAAPTEIVIQVRGWYK